MQNTTQKKQQYKALHNGFSLIELMVVLVVIGILAVVAVPAYQDYVNRTRMTKVVQYAATLEQRYVSAYLAAGNVQPTYSAVFSSSSNSTLGIEGIRLDADSSKQGFVMQVSANTFGGANSDYLGFALDTAGGFSWSCHEATDADTIATGNITQAFQDALPDVCR